TIDRRIAGESVPDPADGYAAAADFIADLEALHDDLLANRAARIANGGLRDLIVLARCFGFHLATLDIRQEAARHHAAVAELIGALPGAPDYAALDEAARLDLLERLIARPGAVLLMGDAPSPETQDALATFAAVRTVLAEIGPAAVETYVVSMADSASA